MKNLNRVLALAMSASMAMSMFATSAGAAYTDEADIKTAEAVNMLSALNIIQGEPDGSFNPDGTVTRAQMAKMIYVAMTGTDNADTYAGTQSTFTDINGHWASSYIKFCQTNKVIAGKTATSFDPDGTVTGQEAAKMLLVVMGFTPERAGLVGPSWATNTVSLASQNGMLDDVSSSLDQGLPRQYAAQMIYNTLSADRVKWSTDSGTFDYFVTSSGNRESVGYKYLGLYTDIGTLYELSGDSLSISVSPADQPDSDSLSTKKVSEDAVTIEYTKLKTDYSSMLGQKVKVMSKDGKKNNVLGIYPTGDNEALTVNAASVEKDGKKIKVDGKSYSIENDYKSDFIDVYYMSVDGKITKIVGTDDGKEGSGDELKIQTGDSFVAPGKDTGFSANQFDNWSQSSAKMTFVDNDGNGKLDLVIIDDYTAAEVTYTSASQIIAGKTYKFDDENIEDGISTDDWAMISYDRYNDCQKIVKADTIEGKVNGTKTGSNTTTKVDGKEVFKAVGETTVNKYSIDSTWYNAGKDKDANTDIKTVKAGDTVKAVTANGVLYNIKRSSAAKTGTLSDVAMVVNKDSGIGGNEVKLQFFNDTTKVVDVDDDSDIKFADLKVGSLYEYSISNDEYSFESYSNDGKKSSDNLNLESDYYGDYTYKGKASYDFSKDAIGGKTIADTARVILFKDNGSVMGNDSKVLTGKQFKALDKEDVNETGTVSAYYFSADINGLNRAGAIALTVKKLPATTKTNDYYGYIVSEPYKLGNNRIEYTIWDGSENKEVVEETSNIGERAKNKVIGYKSMNEKTIDGETKNVIDDVTVYSLSDEKDGLKLVAVDGVSNSGSTVTFISGNEFSTINGDRDIDSDTTVLYVDSDNTEGIAEGKVRGATNYSDNNDKNGAKVGNKFANALAIASGDDGLELLVVDTTNIMVGPYVDQYNSKSSAETLSATLGDKQDSNVEFGTEGKISYDLTSKNIANSTDVAVSAKDSDGKDVSGFSGKATLTDGKATIEVTVANTVAVGTYKVTFKADKAEATVTITVGKKAVDTVLATGVTSNEKLVDGDRLMDTLTVDGADEYTAEVNWSIGNYEVRPTDSVKTNDKVTVTITLTPKGSYTFADSVKTEAKVYGQTLTSSVKDGVVTLTCTATVEAKPAPADEKAPEAESEKAPEETPAE